MVSKKKLFKLLFFRPLVWPYEYSTGMLSLAAKKLSAKDCFEMLGQVLRWTEHAPRADCRDGEALAAAARGGHAEAVRLLPAWPEHAPRADWQCRRALQLTEEPEVVRLLQAQLGQQA